MYKCNVLPKYLNNFLHLPIIIVIFSTLFTPKFNAQNLVFEREFGNFTKAGAFSLSSLDVIYVTDLSTNEVYKLDTSGKILNFIGGYGWDNSTFASPVDVFSNTLNIYVTDKNNDRVQIFDKDLNFLSTFAGDRSDNPDHHFAYPLSAEVSPLGDLFILDSDNSRILKYNLSGQFLQVIGNYESGSYALENPMKLAISGDGNIYVIDQDQIFVFDQYGAGLAKLDLDIEPVNINITRNNLCVNTDSIIVTIGLGENRKLRNFDPPTEEKIVECALVDGRIYLLTENKIIVYKITE